MQTTCLPCTGGAMNMCESNERALPTKNERFHAFCTHFENFVLCSIENLFSLAFISFKTYKRRYFSILFNKKPRTFKDQKPILSTFKALKSNSRNSRVFKGFQDAYEPWVGDIGTRIKPLQWYCMKAKDKQTSNLSLFIAVSYFP